MTERSTPLETKAALERRNRRLSLTVFAVVAGMVGLSFAAVPFYRAFCRLTGFNGTTMLATQAPEKISDRLITVKFNTDMSPDLGWNFQPERREVTVHLGEKALISFLAENRTDQTLTGTALYNVTPPKMGKYFKKMQCFCFGEQILNPAQKAHMPVMFFVDPAMSADPNLDDVDTVTLSYSFFKAESSGLEQALEEFYNRPSE